MFTEDYVSFEIAKLLKEKGFDCNTNCYYIEDSVTRTLFYSPIRENHNTPIKNNEFGIHINISSGKISAPTLQMAMKWLREVHNLVLNPVGCYVDGKLETWEVDTYFLDCGVDATINAMEHIYGKTYEEACEAGIRYCLEKLI